MGLYTGGLIIGRIFASEIFFFFWGGGLFSGGLILFWGGGAYYRNFTVCEKVARVKRSFNRTLLVNHVFSKKSKRYGQPYHYTYYHC